MRPEASNKGIERWRRQSNVLFVCLFHGHALLPLHRAPPPRPLTKRRRSNVSRTWIKTSWISVQKMAVGPLSIFKGWSDNRFNNLPVKLHLTHTKQLYTSNTKGTWMWTLEAEVVEMIVNSVHEYIVCAWMCICIYIYIYIYRERERELY